MVKQLAPKESPGAASHWMIAIARARARDDGALSKDTTEQLPIFAAVTPAAAAFY